MPLSKAKNRERMRWDRKIKASNRLHVQLKLTPEVADYLEWKAGNKTVEEYIIGQITKAAGLDVQPEEYEVDSGH